jgi:arylsulfatase A-like enzyme
VPCVIKPPANTFSDTFAPGSFNRSFSTVMDFAPTFLEMASVSIPPSRIINHNQSRSKRYMIDFRNRAVHAMRGKSMLPFFAHDKQVEENEVWAIHSSEEPIGWELFARGALRKGDYKIVHFSKSEGGVGYGNDEGWELFNISNDPGETRDLASLMPEKLEELMKCWEEYVMDCGVVWGERAMQSGLSKEDAPDYWQDELELQKSWMEAQDGQIPKSNL